MENKNKLKNKISDYLKISGMVRGSVLQTDKNYIIMKWGNKGLKKVEEKAQELGVKLPYQKTSALEWHPTGLRFISLLLIIEIFNLKDDEIRQMGYLAPKTSFIVKIIMKFFVSLEKIINSIPEYWKEHWTVGELDVVQFDNNNKELIIQLKKFIYEPFYSKYLEGFFEKIPEFVVKKAFCQEINYISMGKNYHEYKINW